MEENTVGQLKKCAYCAEDISADAARCPRCGTILDAVAVEPEHQYQQTYAASTGNNGTGMAIASFVLGILGIICCCVGPLGSVLAIVFGCVSRSQIKKSGMTHMSWMATTGIVLGIVNIILTIIGTLIWFMLMILAPRHGGGFPFPIPQ